MNDKAEIPVSTAMQLAADAAQRLEADGITVIAAYANGRRPVLYVNHPPQFVVGGCKRRHPNGIGGFTQVFAASFHGCQLEWMRDVSPIEAVRHG